MRKHVRAIVLLCGFCVAPYSHAIDRDASAIVGLGYSRLNCDGTSGSSFNAGGEFALGVSSNAPFGMLVRGSTGEWDSDGNEEFSGASLGLKWYQSKKASWDLVGFYERSDWNSGIAAEGDGVALDGVWDAEAATYGLDLSFKYRVFEADNDISPYLIATLGVSKTDAEATDGFVDVSVRRSRSVRWWWYTYRYSYWETDRIAASDLVEYKYDPSISFILSPGVDVMLTKYLGVNIGADIGVVSGGATLTVGDAEFESGDDMRTVWAIGGTLKYYFQ